MPSLKTNPRIDAKHPKVTQDLREMIFSGRYAPGHRLPLRDEFERELGASRMTVQTALNTLIAEGFLRTVTGTGTFVADQPPFMKNYGVVFFAPEEFTHHRFHEAMKSRMASLAARRGGRIVSYHNVKSLDSPDHERAVADAMAHRVAGFIFVDVCFGIHDSPLLTLPSIPRVAIQDGPNEIHSGACVYPDLMEFHRACFERCAKLGRRKVAVFHSHPDLNMGMIDSLARQFNVECPRSQVISIHPEWPQSCRNVLELMFSLPRVSWPDALIIADDNIVADVTASLMAIGLGIPKDLAVVAMGNLPILPRSYVPCDFVAFDAQDIARVCFDSIDRQRQGTDDHSFVQIKPAIVSRTGQSVSNSGS